jgi:hypothetical protein
LSVSQRRSASRKYWDELPKELRPIYTAVNDEAVTNVLAEYT